MGSMGYTDSKRNVCLLFLLSRLDFAFYGPAPTWLLINFGLFHSWRERKSKRKERERERESKKRKRERERTKHEENKKEEKRREEMRELNTRCVGYLFIIFFFFIIHFHFFFHWISPSHGRGIAASKCFFFPRRKRRSASSFSFYLKKKTNDFLSHFIIFFSLSLQ